MLIAIRLFADSYPDFSQTFIDLVPIVMAAESEEALQKKICDELQRRGQVYGRGYPTFYNLISFVKVKLLELFHSVKYFEKNHKSPQKDIISTEPENPLESTPFLDLPSELLEKIYQHLPQCNDLGQLAQTSKHFRNNINSFFANPESHFNKQSYSFLLNPTVHKTLDATQVNQMILLPSTGEFVTAGYNLINIWSPYSLGMKHKQTIKLRATYLPNHPFERRDDDPSDYDYVMDEVDELMVNEDMSDEELNEIEERIRLHQQHETELRRQRHASNVRQGSLLSLAVKPSGGFVITTDSDLEDPVMIYEQDAATGEYVNTRSITKEEYEASGSGEMCSGPSAIAVSMDNEIAIGTKNNQVDIWSLAPDGSYKFSQSIINETCIAPYLITFMPKSRLAFAAADGKMKVWFKNEKSEKYCELLKLHLEHHKVSAIHCMSTGRLVTGGRIGDLRIIDINSEARTYSAKLVFDAVDKRSCIKSITSFPTGELVVGYREGYLSVWRQNNSGEYNIHSKLPLHATKEVQPREAITSIMPLPSIGAMMVLSLNSLIDVWYFPCLPIAIKQLRTQAFSSAREEFSLRWTVDKIIPALIEDEQPSTNSRGIKRSVEFDDADHSPLSRLRA